MVGLDVFREFFKEYYNCYIAIGGSACDDYFEGQGLEFRTTDDIDIILVVEAVDDSFITHFWKFAKKRNMQKIYSITDFQILLKINSRHK